MRVLIVTNMYPSAERPGWGSFVKSQVDSLVESGIEVDLLVIEGYKSQLRYLTAIFRLWRLCLRRRYDLVHAHYGLSGIVARAQFRYPVLVSFTGDDLYGHPTRRGAATLTSRFWAALHRMLAGYVDGVIVKSRRQALLLNGRTAIVIPNGVCFDRFRPMDRAACRRTLGLDPDREYILFAGAPSQIRKNYPIAEAAVHILRASRGRSVELLTLEGRPHEDVPVFMNAADVVVLVSMWEGSPNVIKEAMACNTRIVASDVGDVPEVINGVEGCLICETNPVDLADKIEAVLMTPAKTQGRAAIEHLRIEAIAERIIAEYRRVSGSWGGERPA